MHKISFAAIVAALLAACGQSDSPADSAESTAAVTSDTAAADTAGGTSFSSEDDRTFYALGLVLGQNIGEFGLTAAELDIVAAGMRDAVTEAEYQVDINTYGPLIQDLANRRQMLVVEAEKQAGAEFAAEVAAEPGAERTASGLVYVPVAPGDGEMPQASDTVRVHYHGTLTDGSVFDSSRDRGSPLSFSLEGVIPCWTEGVQKMQVGATAKLLCPSDIAYGDMGSPPVIPGGATLMFEVELLEIVEQL